MEIIRWIKCNFIFNFELVAVVVWFPGFEHLLSGDLLYIKMKIFNCFNAVFPTWVMIGIIIIIIINKIFCLIFYKFQFQFFDFKKKLNFLDLKQLKHVAHVGYYCATLKFLEGLFEVWKNINSCTMYILSNFLSNSIKFSNNFHWVVLLEVFFYYKWS